MSDDDAYARLAARLDQLEARLDEATSPAASPRPDGPTRPDPDEGAAPQGLPADLFWALQGLKARESAPAVVYTGVVRLPGQPGPVEWQMGHYVDDLLAEDWADRAAALSALGHPVRLQILQLIARGEASTAAELAATEGLGTTGQVYHHLKQLVSAGWLRSAARGTHHIPAERLVPLLVLLGASH